MSAVAYCEHCWLEDMHALIDGLDAENTDDIHPMGRGFYREYLQEAKDAWCRKDLRSIAEAVALAVARLDLERRYRDESRATARGLQ